MEGGGKSCESGVISLPSSHSYSFFLPFLLYSFHRIELSDPDHHLPSLLLLHHHHQYQPTRSSSSFSPPFLDTIHIRQYLFSFPSCPNNKILTAQNLQFNSSFLPASHSSSAQQPFRLLAVGKRKKKNWNYYILLKRVRKKEVKRIRVNNNFHGFISLG